MLHQLGGHSPLPAAASGHELNSPILALGHARHNVAVPPAKEDTWHRDAEPTHLAPAPVSLARTCLQAQKITHSSV